MAKKTKAKENTLATFEWPEYASDKLRIKANSNKYKNVDVVDAFNDYYGLNMKVDNIANLIPQELNVGDTIKTRIVSISKGAVVFDVANLKTNVQSSINLHKYEKFKHFLPMDEITAIVTRKERDKVVIDPISPMVNEWLTPVLSDTASQKVIPTPENPQIQSIKVKNLQLTRGGFTGKAVVPNVSDFVGEDYTIDAFIPGSQIVLNIAENFEQFNGKTVDAMVVNYMKKPFQQGMSLVCSVKERLKFIGELNMIQLFNSWCEESELWKTNMNTVYEGEVTGVINTAKKCGVFVEIPELSITGMVQAKPNELVNYKRYSKVSVKLTGFDEEMFFNSDVNQLQHVMPYVITDGVLRECNLKPILQFV